MKQKFLIALLFLASIILFSKKVIHSFKAPLYGLMDTETWEYNGYFIKESLNFNPFPSINFINDGTLFPYGTNQVFQAWGLERDFFYSILTTYFGIGPWLQIYYLLTIFITLIGSYLLLKKDFGINKAAFTSILLTYFNFYSMYKYPFHLNFAVVHWAIIGTVLDFLVYRKYVNESKIDLTYILFRLLILTLSLGLDLGGIAGFSIFSCFIFYSFLFIQILTSKIQNTKFKIQSILAYSNTPITIITTLLILFFVFLYIPIILQILQNTKELMTSYYSNTPEWYWWSNPLRIFIPFVSPFNPGQQLYESVFNDHPEGQASGSIGLFILFLGCMGLYHSKNKIKLFLPLFTLFLFYITYHPQYFPVLKIFPWFQHLRVASRVTINYSIIFALFSLGIDYSKINTKLKKGLFIFLIILGIVELKNAYHAKAKTEAILEPQFFTYMDAIQKSNGTAILDFPFCISSGNMDSEFCPFPANTSYVYALKRFHHKKVIGQFFGRMFPENIQAFKNSGWDKIRLFQYDITKSMLRTINDYQCFNEDEWKFFDRFYKENDFSGIQLYESVIPKDCIIEFYKRYGNPMIETSIPFSGKLSFIKKN